jgi:hypothetical protein
VSKKGGGKPEATRDGCVIAHMLERAARVSVLVLDYTKTPSHWMPSQVLPPHALLAASRSAVAVAVGSVTNHEPLPGNTAAYPGEEGHGGKREWDHPGLQLIITIIIIIIIRRGRAA